MDRAFGPALVVVMGAVIAAAEIVAAPPESKPMTSAPSASTMPAARPFGRLADGREATLYVLEVPGGWRAEITDYGAILVRMLVPTAEGPAVDVALGCDDVPGYQAGSPYFGAICGRVSNRIAGGTFELDGKTHTLAKNNGANHLHGGVVGFDKHLWKASPRMSPRGPAVDFEHVSPAGDEGYPGRLVARVTYTLTPDGELWVEMSATTDAPTVVNMVHHSYWNLAGHAAGTIRDHELVVHADHYLPVDAGSIPTGVQAEVVGTAFDFRPERRPAATLGAAIDGLPPAADGTNPGGVDHDFVIRGWRPDGALRPVAVLRDPGSGRTLELLSDQPGVQVYTGNYLDGTVRGKGDVVYAKHAGVCLETQLHPDSVHRPEWPSPRLDPGKAYRHTMVHRFTPR